MSVLTCVAVVVSGAIFASKRKSDDGQALTLVAIVCAGGIAVLGVCWVCCKVVSSNAPLAAATHPHPKSIDGQKKKGLIKVGDVQEKFEEAKARARAAEDADHQQRKEQFERDANMKFRPATRKESTDKRQARGIPSRTDVCSPYSRPQPFTFTSLHVAFCSIRYHCPLAFRPCGLTVCTW